MGFDPNNKAGPRASNALSAAAEQEDVETTKMVLNCRNRIRGFENDAVRNLIIFGIDRGLIDVGRDLATPRGGEDVVPKLLENEARMNELRRVKAEADRGSAAVSGGGGGGGGNSPNKRVHPEGVAPAKQDPCCVIS